MASPEQIADVRAFNRFYTARLGLTRSGLHRTPYPLAEARVLYELGTLTEVGDLRAALAIDAGQLSRLLSRLEAQGLVSRHASPLDARRQQVRLTTAGEQARAHLEQGSSEEVGALLDELPDREATIHAMRQLQAAIDPPPHRTVTLRGLQPGDLGWLVQRHGELYAREYGWDHTFEQLAAQIVADFNPTQDRAWIAEVDRTNAGVVLCVHEDETNAKLRTLLVEPHARGLGIGGRLVQEVIRYAKHKNYATLRLWTNDSLTAARRIYERAGFTLEHEAPHHAFGHDLVEQTWSLNLSAWTETP